MNSKHTPGPWRVGGENGYVNQCSIEPSIGAVYGAGEELKANAALVAAAPELLEALQELRYACMHRQGRINGRRCDCKCDVYLIFYRRE